MVNRAWLDSLISPKGDLGYFSDLSSNGLRWHGRECLAVADQR